MKPKTLCGALLVLPLLAGAATPVQSTADKLFQELKSMPQDDDRGYFDMHGNANKALQRLMIGRFEFTASICAEIDATSAAAYPQYISALCRVLAVVQDPASIPWLEKQLAGKRRQEIIDQWMPRWSGDLRGVYDSQLRWLNGAAQWSNFFRHWASSESMMDRLAILRVLQAWFDDDETVKFFGELEMNPTASAEEILLSQVHLRNHAKEFHRARTQFAIERLKDEPNGRELLLEYSAELRDESFVPWLIEIVVDNSEEKVGNAQWNLEAITFRRDIRGRANWKAWFLAHKREGRNAWKNQAIAELKQLAEMHPTAAVAFTDKVMYRWNDPILLPDMNELAAFKSLHNQIAGWINLTYTHQLYLRKPLRSLALKIQRESGHDLEEWAKDLMRGWDFLNKDRTTWKEYIGGLNRGV